MTEKVVIITGASSGIGKALAYEYARNKASLVLGARSYDKLQSIADDLKMHGAKVVFAQTDVSVELECRNLVMTAIETYGKVDILINNAGISMRALFENTDLSVIKKLMDINFWGTVYCTKYALKHLVQSKGSIVGVSSIAGIVGLPARTGYSASKFAMNGFLEALRTENLKSGLHILVAHPGFTASNIRNTSLTSDGSQQGESPRNEGKMMTAEKVAQEMIKAIDKRKNTLVLTSEGKMVSLMKKFFPNVLIKLVYNSLKKEPDSPFK